MDTEPNEFMRERIAQLTRNFRKSTQEQIMPVMAEVMRDLESKKKSSLSPKKVSNIDMDDASDDESRESSEQNIFEMIEECHEVPCLDFEMIEDFEHENKENVC